jgi:hypothetical protein
MSSQISAASEEEYEADEFELSETDNHAEWLQQAAHAEFRRLAGDDECTGDLRGLFIALGASPVVREAAAAATLDVAQLHKTISELAATRSLPDSALNEVIQQLPTAQGGTVTYQSFQDFMHAPRTAAELLTALRELAHEGRELGLATADLFAQLSDGDLEAHVDRVQIQQGLAALRCVTQFAHVLPDACIQNADFYYATRACMPLLCSLYLTESEVDTILQLASSTVDGYLNLSTFESLIEQQQHSAAGSPATSPTAANGGAHSDSQQMKERLAELLHSGRLISSCSLNSSVVSASSAASSVPRNATSLHTPLAVDRPNTSSHSADAAAVGTTASSAGASVRLDLQASQSAVSPKAISLSPLFAPPGMPLSAQAERIRARNTRSSSSADRSSSSSSGSSGKNDEEHSISPRSDYSGVPAAMVLSAAREQAHREAAAVAVQRAVRARLLQRSNSRHSAHSGNVYTTAAALAVQQKHAVAELQLRLELLQARLQTAQAEAAAAARAASRRAATAAATAAAKLAALQQQLNDERLSRRQERATLAAAAAAARAAAAAELEDARKDAALYVRRRLKELQADRNTSRSARASNSAGKYADDAARSAKGAAEKEAALQEHYTAVKAQAAARARELGHARAAITGLRCELADAHQREAAAVASEREAAAAVQRLSIELERAKGSTVVSTTAASHQLWQKEIEIRRLRAEMGGFVGQMSTLLGRQQ